MGKRIKRLASPRTWRIPKKEKKFIVKPRPGTHCLEDSISLLSLVRDYLGHGSTGREARRIIREGHILVDKVPRKDPRFPVGLMDVVEIPATKEYYVVLFDKKGKLFLSPLKKKDAQYKLMKITGKTLVKGGDLQLGFHDGRTLLVKVKDPRKPKEDKYRTGDTVVFDLAKKKIKEHLPMEKGALALITRGAHRTEVATVEEIVVSRSSMPNEVILKGKEGNTFRTIKDYVFVIPGGKKK
ncbi:MAG: 30S ribosomal protein S4e [Euryarchaeota archaeon]|nr:30S ribosomal protein S4e [Euryarchaeota archaeon]